MPNTKRVRGDSNEVLSKKSWTANSEDKKFPDTKWRKSVFVPDVLRKEHYEHLKGLPLNLEEMFLSLSKLFSDGYQVTMRWDAYNSCHAVWLSTRDEDSTNYGLILSGRGSTPVKALRQLLFLHFEVWSGEWSATNP